MRLKKKKKTKAKDLPHGSHLVFETQTPAWLGFYISFRCEGIWLIGSVIARAFNFFYFFFFWFIWGWSGPKLRGCCFLPLQMWILLHGLWSWWCLLLLLVFHLPREDPLIPALAKTLNFSWELMCSQGQLRQFWIRIPDKSILSWEAGGWLGLENAVLHSMDFGSLQKFWFSCLKETSFSFLLLFLKYSAINASGVYLSCFLQHHSTDSLVSTSQSNW